MTPAEMREAAALKALKAARDYAGLVEEDALRDIAAAIRALPLAEEAPTPREKLRRVREAREVLATARVAYVRPGIARVYNGATGGLMGGWGGYVQGESIGTFPSPRAAQAACDARLEAAGVRLCGEVVRDG